MASIGYIRSATAVQLKKWRMKDDSVTVCAHFGCNKHLTLQERLYGRMCVDHTRIIRKPYLYQMQNKKKMDSFKDPYIIKQINALPSNKIGGGGYADLAIDNTEKDIVIVWSRQEPDPQVIHIMRDHLDEFIELLKHCKKGKDKLG